MELLEEVIAIVDKVVDHSLELVGEHLMTIVRSFGQSVQHWARDQFATQQGLIHTNQWVLTINKVFILKIIKIIQLHLLPYRHEL